MGARIEAIKRMQQSTPEEVMAGYLLNFVVFGKEHFLKIKYYDRTAYFEMCHDNNAYTIDVLYIGQETSFPLSTFMRKAPDYKSVLAIAPQLLEWLENTYAVSNVPAIPTNQKSNRRTSIASRQQAKARRGALNGNNTNTRGEL